MLVIVLLFFGLAMDSGIVMMEKGASIKDLDIRKTIKYPLIFAVTNIVFLLGGYLFSKVLSNIVDNKFLIDLAMIILFCEGVLFLHRALFYKGFEEKLDRQFNDHKCIALACLTSMDTLCAGICLGLLRSHLYRMMIISFITIFFVTMLGLRFGYSYGAKYQKIFEFIEGACIILFSILTFLGVSRW